MSIGLSGKRPVSYINIPSIDLFIIGLTFSQAERAIYPKIHDVKIIYDAQKYDDILAKLENLLKSSDLCLTSDMVYKIIKYKSRLDVSYETIDSVFLNHIKLRYAATCEKYLYLQVSGIKIV